MPKPDKVEAHVRDWLRDERQDTLSAFVRVITTSVIIPGTPVTSTVSVADLRLRAEALGRQLSDMGWVPGDARALVVSPGTFRILRLSGFKERVKEAEVEAPLGEVAVHHLDDTAGTARIAGPREPRVRRRGRRRRVPRSSCAGSSTRRADRHRRPLRRPG